MSLYINSFIHEEIYGIVKVLVLSYIHLSFIFLTSDEEFSNSTIFSSKLVPIVCISTPALDCDLRLLTVEVAWGRKGVAPVDDM